MTYQVEQINSKLANLDIKIDKIDSALSDLKTAVDILKIKNSVFYGFIGSVPALIASTIALWKLFSRS